MCTLDIACKALLQDLAQDLEMSPVRCCKGCNVPEFRGTTASEGAGGSRHGEHQARHLLKQICLGPRRH